MTTDYRALCVELTDCLEKADWPLRYRYVFRQWVDIARAALADGPAVPEGREPASVACEPSDGDLLQLMPEQFRADLGTVSRMAAHGAGPDITPGLFRVSLNTGALEYARAVLARWGSCQGILDSSATAPPATGEVGERPTDEELLSIAAQAVEPYDRIRLGEYEPENNCALEVYGSELIAFARAVLGRYGHQPAPPAEGEVGEGPTPSDEELLKLARAELNNSPNWEEPEYDASNPFPYEAPGIAWLNFARAVLARFGHQPAPAPAEGEVAELAVFLRGCADDHHGHGRRQFTRAADLLERQAAPVPVAVSERLPEFSDCDAQERLWCSMGGEMWELRQIHSLDTHWLPAHALPLPRQPAPDAAAP